MRQPSSILRHRHARGFTLVELLVSISVLSIMAVGLATMMSFVMRSWVTGINSVDNFTKARVVLNLLDRDIQTMVMRRDLAAFVSVGTGTGTPACAFYSNVEGYPGQGETTSAFDTRTLSLVSYSLINPTTAPTFQRVNYGVNFLSLSSSGTPPTIGNTSNLSPPSNSNANMESVFTGVIQFQIQFIDGNGVILTPPYNLSSTPPSSSTLPSLPTPFWYDYANPSGSYNPRAVVVSMLVLSNSAYKLAQQSSTSAGTATLTALQNDFPVGTSSALPTGMTSTTINSNIYATETYAQYWDSLLNPTSGSFDPTLPAPVRDRGAIEVFERHIPLPITTPSS